MGRESRPGSKQEPAARAAGPSPGRRPRDVTRHRKPAAAAGLTALVLAGVGFVAYATVLSREVPTSKYANLVLYTSPAKVPAFDLARLGSGGRLTRAVLDNGPAAVNWFQSTCVACQAELGTFAAVADKELTRIHFLGVDVNDPSPAAALAMVRRTGTAYPVAEAPGIASISLATRFGVGDLPATVFVSRQGRILGEVLGKVSRAELVALLTNLAAGRPLNS